MPWHLVEAVVLAMPHQGERGAHGVLEIVILAVVVIPDFGACACLRPWSGNLSHGLVRVPWY